MSKSARKAEAKKAEKREKIKKKLILVACVLSVAALVAVGIYSMTQEIIRDNQAEIYSDGDRTVRLYTDGTFVADLERKTLHGAYEKTDLPYVTVIHFTSDGLVEIGFLKDDVLQLPFDWQIDEDTDVFLPRR